MLLSTSFVLKLVRPFYIHGVTSDLSAESNEVSCHMQRLNKYRIAIPSTWGHYRFQFPASKLLAFALDLVQLFITLQL